MLRHLNDYEQNFVGIPEKDARLDHRMYKIEVSDGRREPYAANIITQVISSYVYPEGTRDVVVGDKYTSTDIRHLLFAI